MIVLGIIIVSLLDITGVLLTDESSRNREDAAVTDRSVNKFIPKQNDDFLAVLRGGSRSAGVPSQTQHNKSYQWPVFPNVSRTHETQEQYSLEICPKRLCSCSAMDSRSYDSCMCTDKDVSCWFDGNGCYCRYEGKYCISSSTGEYAECHVKTAYATVCRIDKGADDARSIRLQCLLAGTDQRCDVMLCQTMELQDDGSYRSADPVDSTYISLIKLRLRRVDELFMELHPRAMGCHLPYEIGLHSVRPTCRPTQVNTPYHDITPAGQACSRFTYARGIEGWVDL